MIRQPASTKKAKGRKPSAKSAGTRKVIVDAAAALFAERGYQLTTLGDIADKIGVHLTGLYYYYDNKEQLAFDVIADNAAYIRDALAAAFGALPEGSTAFSRIEVAIDTYLGCVLGPENLSRAAARITSQISAETRSLALTGTRDNNRIWYDLIVAAVEEGAFRSDLDPKLVQMSLLGSMNWTIEWFDRRVGPTGPLAETLKAVFLSGLRAPAHPS